MRQRDMFGDDDASDDAAFARWSDPETSHEAAAMVNVNALEALVLSALRTVPVTGYTTHEIAAYLGKLAGSITPRMSKLEEKGLVVRIGTRVPPGHKAKQTVWCIPLNGQVTTNKPSRREAVATADLTGDPPRASITHDDVRPRHRK